MSAPGPNKTDQYWEERYSADFATAPDWRWSLFSRRVWERFLGLLRCEDVGVDLGAGSGVLTREVRNRGFRCLALERSGGGVHFMRRLVPSSAILQGDVLALPFGSASLDFVVSCMVIEHVDDHRMISECARVLKPGGLALVTSVLRTGPAWYWRRNEAGLRVMDQTHLREYSSRPQFLGVFEQAGFEVMACDTPFIRFPLLDPFLKVLFRSRFGRRFRTWAASPLGNRLRLVTRAPVPGYHAVELLARRKGA